MHQKIGNLWQYSRSTWTGRTCLVAQVVASTFVEVVKFYCFKVYNSFFCFAWSKMCPLWSLLKSLCCSVLRLLLVCLHTHISIYTTKSPENKHKYNLLLLCRITIFFMSTQIFSCFCRWVLSEYCLSLLLLKIMPTLSIPVFCCR